MTALPTKSGFGPRGLLDVQSPAPRGLLDISRAEANIRGSAADAVRNPKLAPLPTLTRPHETNYDGMRKAFDWTGKILDGQNAVTAGLLAGSAIGKGIVHQGAVGRTIDAIDNGLFKQAARVLTPAQEIATAAHNIQQGVPARVAVPGAALRTGGRFAAAVAGARAGAALPFPPHFRALAAVVGGIAGGVLGDELPSAKDMGQGLLNSFHNYGRNPNFALR